MNAIPLLNLRLPLPPIIYNGCHERVGHFFFAPGMRSESFWDRDAYQLNRRELCKLDAGFAPQNTFAQGEAWFHVGNVNGVKYMVISFWDNSIDSRPGSHSTFLILGEPLCFNDAIAKCREMFKEVFVRFKFEVKL